MSVGVEWHIPGIASSYDVPSTELSTGGNFQILASLQKKDIGTHISSPNVSKSYYYSEWLYLWIDGMCLLTVEFSKVGIVYSCWSLLRLDYPTCIFTHLYIWDAHLFSNEVGGNNTVSIFFCTLQSYDPYFCYHFLLFFCILLNIKACLASLVVIWQLPCEVQRLSCWVVEEWMVLNSAVISANID